MTDDGGGYEPGFLFRVAAACYGVGVLVLLSPVISDVSHDGQVVRAGRGGSLCGLTITSAFVVAAASDAKRQRKADCASQASDRVGYGFLALVVAAPLTASAFAARRSPR